MIRLAHCKRNMMIEMESGKASVLVVEDPIVMRELLLELDEQVRGMPGAFTLSENFEPLPVSQNLILIKDLIGIDCNEKKVLAKLYQNIENEEKAQSCLGKKSFDEAYLEYLNELCQLSSLPLSFDERLDVGELLKCAHVVIEQEADNYIERLWHYIKVMGDLLHVKVFAFVNLKSFLSNDELDLLYTQCCYEQKLLFLLESHETPPRADEKKYIIDLDGCLIYY